MEKERQRVHASAIRRLVRVYTIDKQLYYLSHLFNKRFAKTLQKFYNLMKVLEFRIYKVSRSNSLKGASSTEQHLILK